MASDILNFIDQHIFDIISAIGIVSAILIGARQNNFSAKAMQAQSFLNLHGLDLQAHGPNGEDGIAAIVSLKKYNNYDEFTDGETEGTRQAIYNAVAFLNFIAILGEEKYLNIQDAWNIYFWVYRKSYENLFPWWLGKQRAEHPHVFPGFERACLVAGNISNEQINAFDKGSINKYVKSYYRTSKIKQASLRAIFDRALMRSALPKN
jgi:hypothetical protein